MSSSPNYNPTQFPAELSPGSVANQEAMSAWKGVLNGYIERAHQDKTDLSVLLLDIDALKAANDEVGHYAGDRLISIVDRLSALVPQSLRVESDSRYPERSADVVNHYSPSLPELDKVIPGVEVPEPQAARIGGDEFGIILPDTDRNGANIVADRLREKLTEELKLPENLPLAKVGVGISIGGSTLEPGMTRSDLLRLADQSMYADKLRQLRPLSDREKTEFHTAIEYLERAGVRPRDVPKYLRLLGTSAVTHAIENRNKEIAGQLTLVGPETGQADS